MTTYMDPDSLYVHGRNALPALVWQHQHRLSPDRYWELVRAAWTGAEWPLHKLQPAQWRALFKGSKRARGRRQMLLASERQTLRKMHNTITVYRGEQGPESRYKWSWTLDRDRAVWFARRFNHLGNGRLLTGHVAKRNIVAYFDEGRGEQEIVVTSGVTVDHVEVIPVLCPANVCGDQLQ